MLIEVIFSSWSVGLFESNLLNAEFWFFSRFNIVGASTIISFIGFGFWGGGGADKDKDKIIKRIKNFVLFEDIFR